MKVICWNMNAAFGSSKQAAAWDWLNAQGADVALLQEALPPSEEVRSSWRSVVFSPKYKAWGSAVLVRDADYELARPSEDQPWLAHVKGAATWARPIDDALPQLVSVHSGAYSLEDLYKTDPDGLAALPSREGITRCDPAQMWEIEVIAHELSPSLKSGPFVLGGDLNSALLFDRNYGGDSNSRLFDNLAKLGFVDTRPRHFAAEVRTFFQKGKGHYQLDHVFADAATETRVSSWRVVSEAVEQLSLSDHAPIEVVIDV